MMVRELQKFLAIIEKGVLRDKAWLEMFGTFMKSLNPVKGLISKYSLRVKEGKRCLSKRLKSDANLLYQPSKVWVVYNAHQNDIFEKVSQQSPCKDKM